MSITVQTLNANGEVIKAPITLNQYGQATIIQAQSGERFQLTDDATGFAPENIEVQRVGDDLIVAFEGQPIEQPGLIIENYYTTAGNTTNNILVGLHENGHIYPYIPETAQVSDAIYQLAQGVSATQAIGGSIVAAGAVALPLWPLALLPLAGVAALAGGGGKDKAPALPVAKLSGVEKVNEGVGIVEYTVTLDKPAPKDVTIKYTIQPNQPTTVEDFENTPMTGSITIPKGSTSAIIPVGINNDKTFEGEESYTVIISEPTQATIGKDKITTTIIDNGTESTDGRDPNNPKHQDPNGKFVPDESKAKDDDRPVVSIDGKSDVNEGEGEVVYTLKLDKPSAVETTVTVEISNITTNNDDFGTNGIRTQTITFVAGETSKTITVDIANDDIYESANGGEKYQVRITDVKNATKGVDSITTTIWDNGTTDGKTNGSTPKDPANPNKPHDTDDDRGIVVSITGEKSVNEGIGEVEYTVSLNKVSDKDTTVEVFIQHGSTDSADFSPELANNSKITTIRIPAGELSQTLKLKINNDPIFENSENYTLILKNPSNATLGTSTAETTIWDNGTTDGSTKGKTPQDPANPDKSHDTDDDRPVVSINGKSNVNEGEGEVVYTLKLDKPSAVETTVTVEISNITTNNEDFGTNGIRTETITFAAGETSKTISVDINNDDIYESAQGGEKYQVRITDVKNATKGVDSITTTIWDNGKTDGKTDGTIPKDPANPNKPHDTDDDRAIPKLKTEKNISIVEGKSKAGQFEIKFEDKKENIDTSAKLQSLTINDGNKANIIGVNKLLNASEQFPIDIKLPFDNGAGEATLKIIGFDANTGIVKFIYSSLAQTHPDKINELTKQITLTVTSTQGKTVTLDNDVITFGVQDTSWTAKDDLNQVDENQAVSGNLITGEVTNSTTNGINQEYADIKGADKVGLIGIAKGEIELNGDFTPVNANEVTSIPTTYGNLTIQSNGSYTYNVDAEKFKHLAKNESVTDIFTYKIKDADGDTSKAALKIQITGKDDLAYITPSVLSALNLRVGTPSTSFRVYVEDPDNEEYYLKAYNQSNKFEGGETIQGYYGSYTINNIDTTKQDFSSIYNFNYALADNAVIKAIKENKIDLVIHEHLNVEAIGATGVEGDDKKSGYESLGIAIYNSNKNTADIINETENNDVYFKNGELNTNIDTLAGNDVVVINSASGKTINLGVGNDYFYAKGNISATEINGGDGDDLFSLYSTATNGSKIIGGEGKDVLILGANTKIDGTELSIEGIEVIDLRNGVSTTDSAGSPPELNNAKNTVTITGEALAANGVTTVHLFRSNDDKVELKGFEHSEGTNTYTYTAGNTTYTIIDELNIGINIV